jgi:ElaB/YqjD/DUF883 family membrane-anchored ribosome-binding protein
LQIQDTVQLLSIRNIDMAVTTNLANTQLDALDDEVDTTTSSTTQDGTVVRSEAYASDMARLQEEMSALKSTVTTLLSEAGIGAAKTLRAAGEVVTHQGTALAATASDRAHSFASELESLARRKPLSTIAGALLAGVIIGLLGRRRP